MKYNLTNTWQEITLESGDVTAVQNKCGNDIRIYIGNTIPTDDTARLGFILKMTDVLRYVHDGRLMYGIAQYGDAVVETL